ncbi:MAG TPA: type I DNA topoisomerase [Gaiellaceae bacterium]|nr:type I DNA topoisomerase [Gaiellaceae bacterium]
MGRRLVIVESPAKARTIAGYLGPDFVVESSVGHIRDLPERASQIPPEKRERFGTLGVDVERDFEPLYVESPDKKKKLTELRKRLKEADELLLATDEDREGEAIAWHLLEVLKPKVPVRRMVFHEITREAIERALEHTRDLDERLVDAQETRRILDRLYGYEISPVLWKKVATGLSAGRVQSVATRLVVERERARIDFVPAEWWDLEAELDPGTFTARLAALGGRRVAVGRDFGADGRLKDEALVRLDGDAARALVARLREASFSVAGVERKPYARRPAPPFITSTLQQEASRKLRLSAQATMSLAQRLYENGYITYMRTDSTTLSEAALAATREQVRERFGPDYVPERPRTWDRKVKNAQEAHEAIRPAGDRFRSPEQVASQLSRDELALYELIWRRTLASQMPDARGETVSVRIAADDAEFATAGTVITFRGFLAAYEEGRDDEADAGEEERRLPSLEPGQVLELRELRPEGHATTPPPRYTEPTLVRALEELGIGRPSTYAAIIGTILDRGYVFKRGSALVPSFVAFSVVELLKQHFGRLVDYDFTARMEDDLDRIATGDEQRVEWLRRFYFGDGGSAEEEQGLHDLVSDLDEIDARALASFPVGETGIVLRVGRYGPFLQRGDERAQVPPDIAPDELTSERAEELLARQSGARTVGVDPDTGRELVVREGRYGPYVTEVLPEGEERKPRTASLLKSMSPESVTLEDALRLLSLPRVVGADPADGEEITAQLGRYGPYIRKGSESRSLEDEEQLFSISLDEALALLAAPKSRGRRAAAAPLKELGDDPSTGKPIVLRSGRFGPYVTDGETNASLRSGDDPDHVTHERAVQLLAERRARGPASGGRGRRPARRKR